MEVVFVGKQGQRIAVEGSVNCRRVDGKPGNTRGVFRDITERKRAEETLQRLRDQHALILNSVAEGVHGLDLDGQITFENPASAAMLGYEIPALIGTPAHSMIHHTRPDGTPYPPGECPIHATLTDGLVRHVIDEVFWRKDGTSFPVEYTSAPLRDEEGGIIGVTVVFTDITERKRLKAQVAETYQQLLVRSRQAGMAEVATSVLHNVGNVLNSVNVSSTLIADQVRHSQGANIAKIAALFDQHQSDLAGFLTTDHRGKMIPGYLNTLAESLAAEQTTLLAEVDHLRQNIEHIKGVIAVQQAHARAFHVIETAAVTDMLEDALRITADVLAQHSVKAIRDYQSRPVVTTDRHKVTQILINLVSNAKLACVESGRTDKQITVRTTSGDRGVKIAVIDNGVGVPAENLTRIFNRGFTTRKDGHGFGLHSAALAARELGGSLTVQSDGPGRGATFILSLPLNLETPTHEIYPR